MIPVRPAKEPKSFDKAVRVPGNTWLKKNPGSKRPPARWIPFTPDLEAAYGGLCGYAALHDPTGGTVDHYLSVNNRRDLAYEWSNYRFASSLMNSSKRTADDTVLDPEQVGAGWFEILLPSLQMVVTDKVPPALRAKAEFTLSRLKLDKGVRVIRWRRSYYDAYVKGGLTLDQLRIWAPLIADAVQKSGAAKD